MFKTFVEVITSIKDGETWENKFETITRTKGGIVITLKNDNVVKTMCFNESKSYSLVVESVSFTEALKAYEEGEIIKSLVTKYKYKKDGSKDLYFHLFDFNWYENNNFEIEEIRGQWQILN